MGGVQGYVEKPPHIGGGGGKRSGGGGKRLTLAERGRKGRF